MININGKSTDPRSARLSNFTDRLFEFDTVSCAGIEGILQALKCPDPETQKEICALRGWEAKRRGMEFNNWKESQILWWQGRSFHRSSREYIELITRIYDSVFSQDITFVTDLLSAGYEDICHSIGNPDMRDTVLTEVEMIHQLNRLRVKALGDHR